MATPTGRRSTSNRIQIRQFGSARRQRTCDGRSADAQRTPGRRVRPLPARGHSLPVRSPADLIDDSASPSKEARQEGELIRTVGRQHLAHIPAQPFECPPFPYLRVGGQQDDYLAPVARIVLPPKV